MKVILLKDIKGVGKKFEEKSVSDGYALNFLIPKDFALLVNKANLAKVKQLQEQNTSKKSEEEEKREEKQAKREEKSLELEKFRQENLSTKLEAGHS